MIDYIREGLLNELAPPAIYDAICDALDDVTLTEEEREELLRQKAKAEDLAMKTRGLFKFEPRK